MWVDSHCHLSQLKYGQQDNLDAALLRAKNRQVEAFLCVATDIENTRQIQQLCADYDNVCTSAGVHPLNFQQQQQWQLQLQQLARESKCVAIGETGLDFYYAKEPQQQQWQLEAFEYHIELSKQLQKPLIIHTRDARKQTLALLESSNLPEKPGVIHCFTEDIEMAEAFIDLGFYISFSGIVTFKNAQDIQHAMKNIPLERILIETDSPYLAPVPYRGKSNFPEFVVEVGEFIAAQRKLDIATVAAQTSANYYHLFNLNQAKKNPESV